MKKVVFTLLPILVIALAFCSVSAMAQTTPDDYYALGYYSGANITGNPDGTLRLINDGSAGEKDLCAAIYVFDNSQEMQACGSCPITADGIISESVNNQLVGSRIVLTSEVNHAGVIKVLSTATGSGPTECSASVQYSGAVTPGIRGWITHVQAGRTAVTPQITESDLKDSNATTMETSDLETECEFLLRLGSGHGVVTCTPEDYAW
jgi:hypothetical protein